MNYAVLDFLEREIGPESAVFEYGCGGSTVWFAERARFVLSIEHDPQWARTVGGALDGFVGASVVHVPAPGGDFGAYVASTRRIPDGSTDVVVVDGRRRVDCVRQASPKVAPGGVLVLDDADRLAYREAYTILAKWQLRRLRGLKAGSAGLHTTAVWRRPVSSGN